MCWMFSILSAGRKGANDWSLLERETPRSFLMWRWTETEVRNGAAGKAR